MVELRLAGSADLRFVMELEAEAARNGFVSGDPEAVHAARMQTSGAVYLIITLDGQAAGYAILCGLNSIDRNVELKRIVVAAPGQGIGRAALRAVIGKVFGEWEAHRLWLDVFPENQRARRVYRNLGFVEEGTLRECVWQSGMFRSLVVMSMLEGEFS